MENGAVKTVSRKFDKVAFFKRQFVCTTHLTVCEVRFLGFLKRGRKNLNYVNNFLIIIFCRIILKIVLKYEAIDEFGRGLSLETHMSQLKNMPTPLEAVHG